MSDTTKKPTKQPQIVPPADWKDTEGFGFLRAKDAQGQAVDLVRLSDLVKWIEADHRIPRPEALQALIDRLPDDVMTWLYRLSPNTWTLPINEGETFGAHSAESLKSKKANAYFEAARSASRSPSREIDLRAVQSLDRVVPVEPGLPALRAYLVKWQKVNSNHYKEKDGSIRDMLDHPGDFLAYLAIPYTKAHAHLNWGRVVEAADSVAKVTSLRAVPDANAEPENWAQLIEFRKKHLGAEWSIKQKNIVANEAKTRTAVPGSKGVKEAMAGELGCSVARINKLIREKDTEGKKTQKHPTAATSSHRSVSASFAKS